MQERVLLIVSEYHQKITHALHRGAKQVLQNAGFEAKELKTIKAPGAFELPCLASRALKSRSWDCVICLGCLIKGETVHFEHIAEATTHNLQRISVEEKTPVIFGVLTANTWQQALDRSQACEILENHTMSDQKGEKSLVSNKGAEAANAALMMMTEIKKLEQG